MHKGADLAAAASELGASARVADLGVSCVRLEIASLPFSQPCFALSAAIAAALAAAAPAA